MDRVLYIASSSYSGSTLLSFLLNAHPGMMTVGEMEGWEYGPDQRFLCSCGSELPDCLFFRNMKDVFDRSGLPFAYDRFGTAYRIVDSSRLNRSLTANLPGLRSSGLERMRDAIVGTLPVIAGRIRRCHEVNRTFIRSSLQYRGASVFVDATKDPFRARFLARGGFDVRMMHLFRDPRGVALSYMEHRNYDAEVAAARWIREQLSIMRVIAEMPMSVEVYHEDVCERTNETLGLIHRAAELEPQPCPDDFRDVEHHILGNTMRLDAGGRIVSGSRWKTALARADRHIVENRLASFVRSRPRHRLSGVIRYYLGIA